MSSTRRTTLRRVAIGALVVVVWLAWPIGSLIYRQTRPQPPRQKPRAVPSVGLTGPATTLGWTVAQARAAIARDRIARLPGAPAVLDTDRIRAALAHRTTRVIALPFAGVTNYRAYDKQVDRLAAGHRKLVIVTGLTVRLAPDAGAVTPSTMAEIRQILATRDLTTMVLTGIDGKSRNGNGPRVLRHAPSRLVDTVAAALSAHRAYAAPGMPALTARPEWNRLTDGPPLLLVTLPPGPPDDLAARLADRFRGDLVVVVRGQWTDLAGPDPGPQAAAVNGYYGQYFSQTATWGPSPASLGLLVARYYGKGRANAAVVEHPARAADPLPVVLTWLPWIFAGTVGVLLLGTLALRWRLVARRRARRRAETARRARLQVRVAGTGARLAHVARFAPDPADPPGAPDSAQPDPARPGDVPPDGARADRASAEEASRGGARAARARPEEAPPGGAQPGGAQPGRARSADAPGARTVRDADADRARSGGAQPGRAQPLGVDELLARASERYRTARDLATGDGDVGVATEALDAADGYLDRAAALLSVPDPPPAATPPDGDATDAAPPDGDAIDGDAIDADAVLASRGDAAPPGGERA